MSNQTNTRHGCSGCLFSRAGAFIALALLIVVVVWLWPFLVPGGAIYESFNTANVMLSAEATRSWERAHPTVTPTPLPTATPEPFVALTNTVAGAGWEIGLTCLKLAVLTALLYIPLAFILRKLHKPQVLSTTPTGDILVALPDGNIVNTRNMVGDKLTPHRSQVDLFFWLRRIWVLITQRRLIPLPDNEMPMSQTDDIDARGLVLHSAKQGESASFAVAMQSTISEPERLMRLEAAKRSGKIPGQKKEARPSVGAAQQWATALPFTPDQIPVALPDGASGLERAQMMYLESHQPKTMDDAYAQE